MIGKKPKTVLDSALRIVFVVLLAFLLFIPGVNAFVLLFFVPIVAWYVWRLNDKNAELEARVAALEGPRKPKSDQG